MAAVEAVKIKLAKYLEQGLDVEVNVLPYTKHPLLYDQFQTKWFLDIKEKVKFSDCFYTFMCQFFAGMYWLLDVVILWTI